jgi:hypothetical protein
MTANRVSEIVALQTFEHFLKEMYGVGAVDPKTSSN